MIVAMDLQAPPAMIVPGSPSYPYHVTSGRVHKIAANGHPAGEWSHWWLRQLRRHLARSTPGPEDAYFCYPITIRIEFNSSWRKHRLPTVGCIRSNHLSTKPVYYVQLNKRGFWWAERTS